MTDFKKPFLAFSLGKSRILENLLLLLFLPYHISYSIFSHSKKHSSYFCDFCDIFYFFYTFLIAVFFQSFLLKLRKQFANKQFASKFLLTRSILDRSGRTVPQISLETPSSLIELFIVLMQLNGTIHEGDGDRNVINWKYLLWVFKANNKLKECTSSLQLNFP